MILFILVNSHTSMSLLSFKSGGAINEAKNGLAAFDARGMNYLIMIEGKWNAVSRAREEKEKEKVISECSSIFFISYNYH